jgi:hypothetical protein
MKAGLFKTGLLLYGLFYFAAIAGAQEKYHVKDAIHLTVSGTSTFRDWTMESSKGECNAVFIINAAGAITGLSFLSFVTPVQALKSGHSLLDKTAYAALKADSNPVITYYLSSASLLADGTLKCMGKLTLAGDTQEQDLIATAKIRNDKSIVFGCTKKLNMRDFNVTPPKALFGAIKIGDVITLQFELPLQKQ